MSKPVVISHRTLTIGESWDLGYVLSLNKVGIDLTLGTVTTSIRIRKHGATTGEVVRSTANVGDTSWDTDGTDGGIHFLFAPAATVNLEKGTYDVEIIHEDTAPTPDRKVVHARGSYTLVLPTTGTI